VKRIVVLTSGGDASGMNAAIRAVVRTSIDRGSEVYGGRCGYAGLADDDFIRLYTRDVGGIIQHGGTVLGTSRDPAFKEA
jgi:6-phosphofructokinase 1